MTITLYGEPRTKKNSQRMVMAGRYPKLLPSRAYQDYAEASIRSLSLICKEPAITEPVNLQCLYYMQTRRKVDLCNLLEATCDILVAAGVLADDNARIVVSHDGSKVFYDKDNPRVEITIERR